METMEPQTQTHEEFLDQYAQRHPRPTRREVTAPQLPAEPRLQIATRMWRFWAIISPIAMLVIVSVFRVQGAFYGIAHKQTIFFIETATIESILAALAFDIAIVGLMAERVQRKRANKPEGLLGWGLALALIVTGITNFQQGLQVYAVGVSAFEDVLAMGASAVFVFILSAGVPLLAAFLGSVVGDVLAEVDATNKQSADYHRETVTRLQSEHRQALDSSEQEFATANSAWLVRAEQGWTRFSKGATRGQGSSVRAQVTVVRPQTGGMVAQLGARSVVHTQGGTQDARTNGHLTDQMVFQLYTAQPGCSLAEGAQWLTEQFGIAADKEKLRQVLRRRAAELVGKGLRSAEGKFYIEHDINGNNRSEQAGAPDVFPEAEQIGEN